MIKFIQYVYIVSQTVGFLSQKKKKKEERKKGKEKKDFGFCGCCCYCLFVCLFVETVSHWPGIHYVVEGGL